MVEVQGMNVNDAAHLLEVNHHSAKSIIRKYRLTGIVLKGKPPSDQSDLSYLQRNFG